MEEARLQREVDNAEQIFNSLQLSYKEAQVTEGATVANIEVLDRNSYSLTPVMVTPILVAFLLSLALGLGGVIVYERFFERRIRYPHQVALDLGLRIVGVVPTCGYWRPPRSMKRSGRSACGPRSNPSAV